MGKKEAFLQMVRAWEEKNLGLFLEVLSKDVLYSECYGAQYLGKEECGKWFCQWTKPEENIVKEWEIKGAYLNGDTAFFTWTFHCQYLGDDSVFDGISLVRYQQGLIVEIQEFEQTHEKFRPQK